VNQTHVWFPRTISGMEMEWAHSRPHGDSIEMNTANKQRSCM